MEAADSGDNDKPKRHMKTPQQKRILELTYASMMYPSEEKRAELSQELGLSDRQLQMWFCHRRLKDKRVKDKKDKLAKNSNPTLLEMKKGYIEGGSGHESRSMSGSESDSSQFDYGVDLPMGRNYNESPQLRDDEHIIACVEAQLGAPVRSDGPILGTQFDVLPPGAFGKPIETEEQQCHSYEEESFPPSNFRPTKAAARGSRNYVLDEASGRSDAHHRYEPSSYDLSVKSVSTGASVLQNGNGKMLKGFGVQSPATLLPQQEKQERLPTKVRENICREQTEALVDAPDIVRQLTEPVNPDESDKHISGSENGMRVDKKRKSDEVTVGNVETQEKRIRKEVEKQDVLRLKREEMMRREMEKQDRERRKDEERQIREKQRQQERFEREEKRETERREKFLQKESIKAERRRQKEELRREKEEARYKAALEKATTRKLAKESMELIEDERLELMELAALSKGLPSIVSLDYDSLQNLESFRALLRPFPPKSVQLKRPFAVQPWMDSDENIGNLFMVWKFCITFADVLGLWPFTLDEFVQAFHEYDSRLLAEIHIALLKLIIKDVEDVARTPAAAAGTNQCSSANPEGGHPRIVEGAYLWGFDILNWKFHLNALTWPEVLRQFALSAGFGPQLKKKSSQLPCLPDNTEAKGCEDIVSTLRDGSAARSAFAVMREKGISLQRKSRHRVTPGTVKFAAYHVLCLEGSKGLTVIELAHKIQKSGLRDLTTSKTPEASISVALSRDTILFERTAPSTYRVRTPFRKDPADAESILAAAREKMKRYENGFVAGENNDEVEKEEESDGEVSDSPEVEDINTPDASKSGANNNRVGTVLENEKEIPMEDVKLSEPHESIGTPNNKSTVSADINKSVAVDNASKVSNGTNLDPIDTEIDESKSGEPWVQGLAEGEYSELSVEERLNALVALVGISNEGNFIRSILEERLDAANALKKQMWAEAQLDKRRVKEEILTKFHSSFTGNETGIVPRPVINTPLAAADNGIYESPLSSLVKQPSLGVDNMQDHLRGILPPRSLTVTDDSISRASPLSQENAYASERSRLQMKSYIGHKAEETYVYRSLPLGQDRRRNRYWQFVACASRHDPGSGRIFVESPDGYWRLIDSKEAFDALLESLDTRGIRESHLHMMLHKIEKSFKEIVNMRNGDGDVGNEASGEEGSSSAVSGLNSCTIETSSSFRIELGNSETEKKAALSRYQEFQMWMWNECFNSSTLCAMRCDRKRCEPLLGICEFCQNSYLVESGCCGSCHRSVGTLANRSSKSQNGTHLDERMKLSTEKISDYSHPLRIRLLRALLTVIEASVPSEALQSMWTENSRKTWGTKLLASMSTETLLQSLTEFEGAVNRDCLLRNFETTKELLVSAALSRKAGACKIADAELVPKLPWVPQTTSAVALRLFELDGSISYVRELKTEVDCKKAELKPEVSLRFTFSKSAAGMEHPGMDAKHLKVKKSKSISTTLRGGSKFKLGGVLGRPRGRPQKRVINATRPNTREDDLTLAQVLWQQGQNTHGQKLGRGRRTVRKPRLDKASDEEKLLNHLRNAGHFTVPPGDFGQNIPNMQIDGAGNSNSVEASESDEDEYEDDAHGVGNANLGTRDMSDDEDDGDMGTGNSRRISDDDDTDGEDDNELGETRDDNFGDDHGDSEDFSD